MTVVSEPPAAASAPPIAELIRAHQAGIWRYLRFLGAGETEAEDLLQETFLALARGTFEHRSSAETNSYLRTIARRQLLMLRRQQSRQPATIDVDAADIAWTDFTRGDEQLEDYVDALRRCVGDLPGRSRMVIDLHYRAGASRTDIATQLDMQPEGVKTLLRRTRDALRACIERRLNAADVHSGMERG